MNITEVFIGGISPSKCNYYSTYLQRSYSQNVPGRTRNFPIIAVSGLQLRWAPLLQVAFFAAITLIVLSEDFPSFAGQYKRLAGAFSHGLRRTNRRPLYSSLVLRFDARTALSSLVLGVQPEGQPKTVIFFARQLQRTCRLVSAHLRCPDRRWCPQQGDLSQALKLDKVHLKEIQNSYAPI